MRPTIFNKVLRVLRNSYERQSFEFQFRTGPFRMIYFFMCYLEPRMKQGYADLFIPDRNNIPTIKKNVSKSDWVKLFEYLDKFFIARIEIIKLLNRGGKRIRIINYKALEMTDELIDTCRIRFNELRALNDPLDKNDILIVSDNVKRILAGELKFIPKANFTDLEAYLEMDQWEFFKLTEPFMKDGKWNDNVNKLGWLINFLRYKKGKKKIDTITNKDLAKLILNVLEIHESVRASDPIQSLAKAIAGAGLNENNEPAIFNEFELAFQEMQAILENTK